MRPNWFIAFPVAGDFVLQLPPVPRAFRRFSVADVHLTLTFLGACGERAALHSFATLQAGLRDKPCAPFAISLGEVVPMGAARAYTALSALLQNGRPEAEVLLLAWRDVLADAAGVRREKRPVKPHVTLARPQRNALPVDRAEGLQWAKALDLSAVHASLDRVALYTWHEHRREQLFRIVQECPLGAIG